MPRLDAGQPAAGVVMPPREVLQWAVHPLRDFPPWRTMALALCVAVVLAAIKASFDDWGWVLIAAALLFAALAKYLLPTRYEFNKTDLVIRHLGLTQRRPWSSILSYAEGKTGVFLSPFARRHPLENFRGLYILFGPDNRSEVMTFVRSAVRKES